MPSKLISISSVVLLFAAFLLISPTYIYAAEPGFVFNADTLDYQKEKGVVEARGSVEAVYKDIKILAGKVKYFSKEGRVIAAKGFSLYTDNFILSGTDLDYSIRSKSGTADAVELSAGNTKIKSKTVAITPDEIYFSQASFSSCNLDRPHYKISSGSMSYYPKSGWIVEYLGLFWINDIPLVPIPTYVFDTGLIEGMYHKKNDAPLPEIGSNAVDGAYLQEKIVWRLSNFSYGLLNLGFAAKKGFQAGLESSYLINNDNQGNLRINSSQTDGFFGGISHTYYFGDTVKRQKFRQFLYQVLENPPIKKYNIMLEASYRERINYERVSLLPRITLKYFDIPFQFLDFKPKAEISLGNVTEESSGISYLTGNVKSSFDYTQPLSNYTSIKSGMDFYGSWYGSSNKWIKLSGRADLIRSLSSSFEGTLGYSHFFINDGASPYNFENYRYYPFDELRGGLTYRIGLSSYKVSLSYNLPLFTVRDLDYNATIGFHCFDAGITWRAARGEILFDLTLR